MFMKYIMHPHHGQSFQPTGKQSTTRMTLSGTEAAICDCYNWVGGVDAKHTLLTTTTPCAVVLIEAAPMGFLG